MTNKEKLHEYIRQYETCSSQQKKQELIRAMKRIKRKIKHEARILNMVLEVENDSKKRAIAMFNRARQIEKAKSLKSNIKLDIPKELEQPDKLDSYVVVSKMVNVDGKLVEIKEAVYGSQC